MPRNTQLHTHTHTHTHIHTYTYTHTHTHTHTYIYPHIHPQAQIIHIHMCDPLRNSTLLRTTLPALDHRFPSFEYSCESWHFESGRDRRPAPEPALAAEHHRKHCRTHRRITSQQRVHSCTRGAYTHIHVLDRQKGTPKTKAQRHGQDL
jgi:cytochrome c